MIRFGEIQGKFYGGGGGITHGLRAFSVIAPDCEMNRPWQLGTVQ